MWEFFEDRSEEILIGSSIVALLLGICTLVETLAVGWHFWSIFFLFSLAVTIFYCVGVVCYYMYREYVFDKCTFRIPSKLFSSFIFVVTLLNILVVFYTLSGILFTVTLLLIVLVVSVIIFAVWHKNQINSKEE